MYARHHKMYSEAINVVFDIFVKNKREAEESNPN